MTRFTNLYKLMNKKYDTVYNTKNEWANELYRKGAKGFVVMYWLKYDDSPTLCNKRNPILNEDSNAFNDNIEKIKKKYIDTEEINESYYSQMKKLSVTNITRRNLSAHP